MKKITQEEFVKSCKELHNDYYDYSKTEYINTKTKIIIICPKHGEFSQFAGDHKRGCGCTICNNTSKDFIAKANKKHEGRYTYEDVEYLDQYSHVYITCKEHGTFKQQPKQHLIGQGCPKCYNDRRGDTLKDSIEDFVEKANKTHNNKYDYSLVTKLDKKVTIICPEHGQFLQNRASHLIGTGCKKCAVEKISEDQSFTLDFFIEQAKKVHGDAFDYSKAIYLNNKTPLEIVCEKHGSFWQRPDQHIYGKTSCPRCRSSKGEKYVENYLKTLKIEYVAEKKFKSCKNKKSLPFDFYVPKYNLLIEYQGQQHYEPSKYFGGQSAFEYRCTNDQIKKDWAKENNYNLIEIRYDDPRDVSQILPFGLYDLKSFLGCKINGDNVFEAGDLKIGYQRLDGNILSDVDVDIVIFEDYWRDRREVVESRLNNFQHKNAKVFARKCEIREVSPKEAGQFLDKNHIQGKVGSRIKLGLYFENQLVSLMVFGVPRVNMGGKAKEGHWELIRFCNKLNTSVVGGASKLLKNFVKKYSPSNIISYADKCWSKGNLYETLGFEHIRDSKPNYYYVKDGIKYNRFKFRKSELIKQGFDKNKTEKQIMKERNYTQIYDQGTMVFSANFLTII